MDSRIAWAIAQMEQRLGAGVCVADLAREVNLSHSRFTHLFRRETGASPTRYLHALRMIRARQLLESTFLSVKQVMSQVGCNDPSHFARGFRRFHGVAPSDSRSAAAGSRLPLVAADAGTITRIAVLANERR